MRVETLPGSEDEITEKEVQLFTGAGNKVKKQVSKAEKKMVS